MTITNSESNQTDKPASAEESPNISSTTATSRVAKDDFAATKDNSSAKAEKSPNMSTTATSRVAKDDSAATKENSSAAAAKTATQDNPIPSMEEVVQGKVARISEAHEMVKPYVMASLVVGLVPVPVVDLAALTGVQIKMLHSLANQYEIPFSHNMVKSLVAPLISSVLTVTTAAPLASAMKIIPFFGSVSGVISMSVLGGAATYAVGKMFIQHFESGGTFLDFDPETVKTHFQELFEEGKQFATSLQQSGK